MSDYQQQEERETEEDDRTVWETAEVTLLVLREDLTPKGINLGDPASINTSEIAEAVLEAAYKTAHEEILARTGATYSGDLMPGEAIALARLIVRSVLVNGPIKTP